MSIYDDVLRRIREAQDQLDEAMALLVNRPRGGRAGPHTRGIPLYTKQVVALFKENGITEFDSRDAMERVILLAREDGYDTNKLGHLQQNVYMALRSMKEVELIGHGGRGRPNIWRIK